MTNTQTLGILCIITPLALVLGRCFYLIIKAINKNACLRANLRLIDEINKHITKKTNERKTNS